MIAGEETVLRRLNASPNDRRVGTAGRKLLTTYAGGNIKITLCMEHGPVYQGAKVERYGEGDSARFYMLHESYPGMSPEITGSRWCMPLSNTGAKMNLALQYSADPVALRKGINGPIATGLVQDRGIDFYLISGSGENGKEERIGDEWLLPLWQ